MLPLSAHLSHHHPPDCDNTAVLFSASEEYGEKFNGKDQTSCCEQRSITETVINGSMKETVSLTVDAKTETAVFKRFV